MNRFHLKGVRSNISENESQNYDNSTIVFRTAVFHDKTGESKMTLFRSAVDSLKKETAYFINHDYLGKLKTKKLLRQAMLRN